MSKRAVQMFDMDGFNIKMLNAWKS